MRLEVDSTSYRSAMDLAYDANHRIADLVVGAAGSLRGCAGMAGDDLGGQEWARAYDSVADDLVRAAADLGGSFGAVGNLLNASLVNHEGADYGARILGPPAGSASDGDDDPSHGVVHVLPAGVPSASGGSGGQPEGWQWLVDYLEGLLWPNADTGRMRAAGDAWQRAAAALDREGYTGAAMAAQLGLLRSPEIPTAQDACQELSGHARDLAAAYADVGRACHDYAQQVDEHHAEVLDTLKELLGWTVVDQVTGAILSFFTAGAAEVAAQLAQAGILARYGAKVVSILRRLIELARAAAALIGRGLAKIAAILARLKTFLSLKAVRALEKAGSTIVGRRILEKLPAEVRANIDDAIRRASQGKPRFPGHDGKPYANSDGLLPPGSYQEWTAAAAGSKRGPYRVLIEGDPASPNAIYFWDHVNPPVRIGP